MLTRGLSGLGQCRRRSPVFIIIFVVTIMLLITFVLRLLPVRAFVTVTAFLCMLQLALWVSTQWIAEIGLRRLDC